MLKKSRILYINKDLDKTVSIGILLHCTFNRNVRWLTLVEFLWSEITQLTPFHCLELLYTQYYTCNWWLVVIGIPFKHILTFCLCCSLHKILYILQRNDVMIHITKYMCYGNKLVSAMVSQTWRNISSLQ